MSYHNDKYYDMIVVNILQQVNIYMVWYHFMTHEICKIHHIWESKCTLVIIYCKPHWQPFCSLWHLANNVWLTFNSLHPSDVIWWHRSGSTLAQVMTCCLNTSSHYLNQCWFFFSGVLWYSPESNFAANAQTTVLHDQFENYIFEIAAKTPMVQLVKPK